MKNHVVDYIVTHHGDAHRDEFVSICLLLHHYGIVPVYRRDPTEEELNNPKVLVVDVGRRHEPELLNFDHHQFSIDAPPACALTLVLKHLELYEMACLASTWIEFSEILDVGGPTKAAAYMKCTDLNAFFKSMSPVEAQIIRLWQEGYKMDELMFHLGRNWWTYWQGMPKAIEAVKENASTHRCGSAYYLVCDLPYTSMVQTAVTRVADEYELNHPGRKVVATISRDNRGPGWSLYRRNDSPLCDFRRIAEHPSVHFVAPSGFIAKTADMPLMDAVDLLEASIAEVPVAAATA